MAASLIPFLFAFLAIVSLRHDMQPPKSVQLTLKTIGVRLFKLLQNPAIRISLALGFLDAFAAQSSILLLQFASKRLSWSLGHATYLLSIRAAVALLLTLGLLPGTTYLLTKKLKVQPLRADVLILRLSLAALSIGYCLISSSVRSWLLILGMYYHGFPRRTSRHT